MLCMHEARCGVHWLSVLPEVVDKAFPSCLSFQKWLIKLFPVAASQIISHDLLLLNQHNGGGGGGGVLCMHGVIIIPSVHPL